MEIINTALSIIGLLFICLFIVPWIVGDICRLVISLYEWSAEELTQTCTYEMAAGLYKEYVYCSTWWKMSKKCRKCGKTNISKSELVWNEGSKKHRFTEKFLTCTNCGHTVSNQWPQYW